MQQKTGSDQQSKHLGDFALAVAMCTASCCCYHQVPQELHVIRNKLVLTDDEQFYLWCVENKIPWKISQNIFAKFNVFRLPKYTKDNISIWEIILLARSMVFRQEQNWKTISLQPCNLVTLQIDIFNLMRKLKSTNFWNLISWQLKETCCLELSEHLGKCKNVWCLQKTKTHQDQFL